MLSIQGVTKFYGTQAALRGATLPIVPGEVVGLFGANGAGKSTLLKSIVGLMGIHDGWITLDNSPIKEAVYEKIAFITEEGSYFPEMNASEHSEFYEAMLPRWRAERFVKLIEYFEIAPAKKARTLSKGQRAKLEIAIGMSRGATYILMDEPFEGKDLFTRRDFLKLMIAIIEPTEAVLIATHQIEEIANFITRAAVLHEGKIVGDLPMDAIAEKGLTLVEYIQKQCGVDTNKNDWLVQNISNE